MREERIFISHVQNTHPLIQELPKEFQELWFNGYQHPQTKNVLFLQMERIFKNDSKKEMLEVLTLEVADMEALLEWEEDFPGKPFTAIEPYAVFFDGVDEQGRGMFSVGDINFKTMQFVPELEIFITPHPKGILVDFQEEKPEVWYKDY